MNERMSDLLDLASDDEGRSLGFSGDTVVRRARGRRRRRHGGLAIGAAAAAVAGVLGVTQLVGSSRSADDGPAVGPSTSVPTTPSSSAPALSPQVQAIVDRCARSLMPPPPTKVSEKNPETTVSRGTVSAPAASDRTAGFLRGWTLDAHLQDAQGVTATFVNPDGTRWASCQLADGGSDLGDEVDPMGPVPADPVPQSWYGPDGFRHQGATVSWAQVCTPGEGKICSREVYAGALARYTDVASAVVVAPDGTVLRPVFGRYTYVFRHTEQRVAANRPSNDMQPHPPMPVTLLDEQGKQIIRYDYFPSYVVPDSCPSTGGC